MIYLTVVARAKSVEAADNNYENILFKSFDCGIVKIDAYKQLCDAD